MINVVRYVKEINKNNYDVYVCSEIIECENVYLSCLYLERLDIKFHTVHKTFDISYNNLTSLVGCPSYVGGGFNCSKNSLYNLKGAPVEVCGSFDCERSHLESLEGSPKKVGGSFNVYFNHLDSLKGCPEYVGYSFNCEHNCLKDIDYLPKYIGGVIYGYDNQYEDVIVDMCNRRLEMNRTIERFNKKYGK